MFCAANKTKWWTKNTRTIFFWSQKERHTHIFTPYTRTLLTNNNAERGIVCSQERRRRARASERYDQTMRGDARRERWFCYIKSYLKLFCVLYLGLKNLVPETRAHQDDWLFQTTTTTFWNYTGIGSLVVIDELDAEKVHGIITHTDGERFFSSSFFLELTIKIFSIAVVPRIRAFERGGQKGDDFASNRGEHAHV